MRALVVDGDPKKTAELAKTDWPLGPLCKAGSPTEPHFANPSAVVRSQAAIHERRIGRSGLRSRASGGRAAKRSLVLAVGTLYLGPLIFALAL